MSTSINQAFLTGRIGQDAQVREVNGNKVAEFSLATSVGGYTNKDGKEIPEVTQWHHIIAWGNLAVYAERVVKKGALVTVVGDIRYRQFEKDGQKYNYTDIVASSMVVFNANNAEKPAEQKPAPAPAPQAPAEPEPSRGDLPF